MNLKLASGEVASLEIIPRTEAIDILSKPVPRRTWFGRKYQAPHRVSRGPGAAVDFINYGLRVNGKCRAVARIGPAPWGNRPVMAAVGPDLAPYTAYLMRLWGAGIGSDDLVAFLRDITLSFPRDMRCRDPERDFRYLLSLDSMAGWLIEGPRWLESPPVAGRIYYTAGALYAGVSRSRAQPTRYIDPATGQVKSVYKNGRNFSSELRRQQVRFVKDGAKHRFVFILTEPDSPQYAAYRAALPAWVQEYEWGEQGLGWIQPRLLCDLVRRFLIKIPLKENLLCLQSLKPFPSTWPGLPGRS
ncbi:MAG: hypothetical protein HS126_37675 [Anaerolineales bacterium]|nr:hypothetical protein [Anaerolineales bacterium]